ncbi:hypothetical protein RSAG8_06350, partial [Rhizoctonia solani AG-8 WAC10335]
MLGLKVSAILAACIYTVAGVRPPSRHKALSSGPLVCPSGEWYWAPKHVCLPILVTAPGPDPHFPNGGICRPEWYWHQSGYCAPLSPDRRARICPRGYKVNPSNFLCEPNVVPPPGPSQWYWGIKNIFLPTLTEQQLEKRPGPPLEKRGVCPMNWYWYENSYCAPRSGQYLRAECPSGYNWDINMFICRYHLEAQASSTTNAQKASGIGAARAFAFLWECLQTPSSLRASSYLISLPQGHKVTRFL